MSDANSIHSIPKSKSSSYIHPPDESTTSELDRVRQKILAPTSSTRSHVRSSSLTSTNSSTKPSIPRHPILPKLVTEPEAGQVLEVGSVRGRLASSDYVSFLKSNSLVQQRDRSPSIDFKPRSLPSTPNQSKKAQYFVPRSPGSNGFAVASVGSNSSSEMDRVRRRILEQGSGSFSTNGSFSNTPMNPAKPITIHRSFQQQSSKNTASSSSKPRAVGTNKKTSNKEVVTNGKDWISFPSTTPDNNKSDSGSFYDFNSLTETEVGTFSPKSVSPWGLSSASDDDTIDFDTLKKQASLKKTGTLEKKSGESHFVIPQTTKSVDPSIRQDNQIEMNSETEQQQLQFNSIERCRSSPSPVVPAKIEYKQKQTDERYFDKTRQKILDAHKSELLASEGTVTLKKLEEDFLAKTRGNNNGSVQPGATRVRHGSDEGYYIRAKCKALEEHITEATPQLPAINSMSGLEEVILTKTRLMSSSNTNTNTNSYHQGKMELNDVSTSTQERRINSNPDANKEDYNNVQQQQYPEYESTSIPYDPTTNSIKPTPDTDIDNNNNAIPATKVDEVEELTFQSDNGITIADQGLAIAVPIEHDQALLYGPVFAEEYNPLEDDKSLYFIRNRRLKCIGICLFIFVVITITIGAVVGTNQKKWMVVPDGNDGVPPLTERETLIIKLIASISPNATITNTNSESKALKWILFDDPIYLQANDTSLIQRYTLAVLYFATNGDYWLYCNFERNSTECKFRDEYGIYKTRKRFLSNTSSCNWGGVKCTDGNVNIFLPSNNMTGTIPPEIGKIQNLQVLALPKNNLRSTLPSTIGNLERLSIFDILENKFTGTLPEELYSLHLLQKVILTSNRFEGSISEKIGNLQILQAAYLSNNFFTGSFPASIGNLSSLGFLFIYQNQFSGRFPSTIGNLNRLLSLFAHSNLFEGPIPTEMGSLTNLKSLAIDNNKFTGTLPNEILNLLKLDWLKLNSNDLSGTIPASIGNLKFLRTIDVRYNQFTSTIPPEIGQMTNLTNALFSYNKFIGTMPGEICALRDNKLNILFSDCHGDMPIECDCCTACCDIECYTCDPLNPIDC